jgi:uncharacterized protein (DUF1778 family)
MPTASLKHERLEARVTAQQKDLVQRAADLAGLTLSDFIVSSLQSAAEESIRRHQMIELSARSTEVFVQALLNPPTPSERLRAAAREYLASVDKT